MAAAGASALAAPAAAQAPAVPPACAFPVFQFPADAIPRVDGKGDDWEMVGPAYRVGNESLAADDGSGVRPDPVSLDVSVRVGWVKGLNRLYFLYEARDDVWDFAASGIRSDLFELVVDGDRSGGPFIARFRPDRTISEEDSWFGFQNIHAQNYHIFTPPGDKDWAMAWGPQAGWIKRLPYSNVAYRHDLKPGQPGRLVMEMWITPFDHADARGPAHSIESVLAENKPIGMAWAVIDYDGARTARHRFWNLSPHHNMFGQASELCRFTPMPLETGLAPAIKADWSFEITDRAQRIVAFRDATTGAATRWEWDFGDGATSTEQHPVHRYATAGKFVVILRVTGPGGSSKLAKVWDVSFVGDPQK
ncbi:PKD domain-containing protein [Sphingomonas sp.]|uniref:PKD domain-containing protein n=1 Tax=Sphingomonas sp. TaxID=28214 RepID=UPI002EDB9F03